MNFFDLLFNSTDASSPTATNSNETREIAYARGALRPRDQNGNPLTIPSPPQITPALQAFLHAPQADFSPQTHSEGDGVEEEEDEWEPHNHLLYSEASPVNPGEGAQEIAWSGGLSSGRVRPPPPPSERAIQPHSEQASDFSAGSRSHANWAILGVLSRFGGQIIRERWPANPLAQLLGVGLATLGDSIRRNPELIEARVNEMIQSIFGDESTPPSMGSNNQSAIDRMTEQLSASSREVREGETCAICCEDYQAGDMIIRLSCSHALHKECGAAWLARRPECPLCRGRAL